MTKIYRQANIVGSINGFWVTQSGKAPVYFWIMFEYVKESTWPEDCLDDMRQEGDLCILSHGVALELLAHWPEGHRELAEILANDPESEYAATT